MPKSRKILDGVFGEETFDAVEEFQVRAGVKPDGMVGRNTLDIFAEEIAKRNRRHTPISKNASLSVVPKGYRCVPAYSSARSRPEPPVAPGPEWPQSRSSI